MSAIVSQGAAVTAPEPLSDLARSYGLIWDVLRSDTERVLLDLFRADPHLVEEAGTEWWEAHPEWVDHPPPHLERRKP